MIVIEHADFDVDWYQDAVRERWRDGDALIPRAWIEQAAASGALQSQDEKDADSE